MRRRGSRTSSPHSAADAKQTRKFAAGLRLLGRRLRRTTSTLADLTFIDAPARVAKQRLGLAQRFGITENSAIRVTHDLTQEELAQLVGATRETVNKAARAC